jgi:hypothetical protein
VRDGDPARPKRRILRERALHTDDGEILGIDPGPAAKQVFAFALRREFQHVTEPVLNVVRPGKPELIILASHRSVAAQFLRRFFLAVHHPVQHHLAKSGSTILGNDREFLQTRSRPHHLGDDLGALVKPFIRQNVFPQASVALQRTGS